MKQFHGSKKRRSFFEGWYLKHQSKDITISFIPAYHVSSAGKSGVSIQILTQNYSGSAAYGAEQFLVNQEHFSIQIEKNHFSDTGIAVDIALDDFYVRGSLTYGALIPLSSDIMGPFARIPFLQCNHGVLSMSHRLNGFLDINGKEMDFTGGTGYIEKDWGSSFPQSYLWTQCCFLSPQGSPCSVMLSVAHIPMLGTHFTGCICAIWYEGKEYRLATYNRVKIKKYTHTEVILQQGNLQLHAKLLTLASRPLQAPAEGNMTRTVYESASCPVQYRFTADGAMMFDITVPNASFESGTT